MPSNLQYKRHVVCKKIRLKLPRIASSILCRRSAGDAPLRPPQTRGVWPKIFVFLWTQVAKKIRFPKKFSGAFGAEAKFPLEKWGQEFFLLRKPLVDNWWTSSNYSCWPLMVRWALFSIFVAFDVHIASKANKPWALSRWGNCHPPARARRLVTSYIFTFCGQAN